MCIRDSFGTMAAKAVIRDVGRVLDLGYNFTDQFARLIPNELGITLKDALEKEPLIRQRIDDEEQVAELWALALKLEGLARNVGMHAGGVLIAPGKLTDFCPLYAAAGADSVVSQFDKDDVEKAGLVKFDFLGLRTLTILDEAVRLAKEVEGVDIDLATLPLDDRETYDAVFKNANTTAVFQFESGGMKDALVQARPDRLEAVSYTHLKTFYDRACGTSQRQIEPCRFSLFSLSLMSQSNRKALVNPWVGVYS